MKKEKRLTYSMFTLIFIALILIVMVLGILNMKINTLPKKVCHNEVNIEEIEVTSTGVYKQEGEEWFCQYDGTWKILPEKTRSVQTGGNYTKVCLVRTIEEVCEIK